MLALDEAPLSTKLVLLILLISGSLVVSWMVDLTDRPPVSEVSGSLG